MEELEQVYEAALEAIRSGEPAAVATLTHTVGSTPRQAGAKMLIYADGRTVGSVGGGHFEAQVLTAGQAALAGGQSQEVECHPPEGTEAAPDSCHGGTRAFIEVLPRAPALLIVGGGHIGQAVAELGAFLGYRIIVLDKRPEMVTRERFPWAHSRLSGGLDEQLLALPLATETYVVVVTPHQTRDEALLAVLAERLPAYVGLIGSQQRTRQTFERARTLGIPDDFLALVHTPIGLDIGAQTPREIALSILAEITAVRRGKPSRASLLPAQSQVRQDV